MKTRRRIYGLPLAIACFAVAVVAIVRRAHQRPHLIAPNVDARPPHLVTIAGYTGDAMEPFVTRDGHYLLFNNRNEPPANTDIHYAARKDDYTWTYQGKVRGINTPELEGCPTMDRGGRMFFVSPRNYGKTLCTIYTGQFFDGGVTDVRMVESISRKQPGIVNFDVDISPDGTTLLLVDSQFKPGAGPQSADLVIANANDGSYLRSPESERLLANINADALQYAPTISADKLTLYFTRFDSHSPYKAPQIYRSTRTSIDAPFAPPVHLGGLGDYVEGSALSPDEYLLYFHRKDGDRFHLYATELK